jgi:cutinase
VYAVNYPASLSFGQAADGIADAANRIQTIAANCPTTNIVLSGYSQGATFAGYTTTDTVPAGFDMPASITGSTPAAIAPHVAAVVLFRTPTTGFSTWSPTTHHPSPSARPTRARPLSSAPPATRSATPQAYNGPHTAPTRTTEWPTKPPASPSTT